MRSDELMIGNYYIDIDDNLTELSGHELYQMTIKENTNNLGVNEYRPIPLTREWLKDFGYDIERSTNLDYLTEYHRRNALGMASKRDPRMITYDKKLFQYTIWNNLNAQCSIRRNYVHIFQNLYQALTGQRLTIKQN